MLQLGRLVARQERAHHQKNLRLPLVEVARELDEQTEVALLLTDQRRRRMLARSGKVRAVARTADLGQPLRPAADRADLMAERRARAPRFSLAAEGTHHRDLIVVRRLRRRAVRGQRALVMRLEHRSAQTLPAVAEDR